MKKILFILAAFALLAGTACSKGEKEGIAVSGEYTIKYAWPKKPDVGFSTLKVNLFDKEGKPVEDAAIAARYAMLTMSCCAGVTDAMKRNNKGDFLIPLQFTMRGEWEITLSITKDEAEIASQTIKLAL
jgi:hypothetical protein